MELFRPDIKGDIFYFDLDTIIVANIDHMVARPVDTLLSDFYYPWRVASGLMYLTEQSRRDVWDHWSPDAANNMKRFAKGDQTFLATLPLAKTAKRFQYRFPDQIISFKRNMRPQPPFPPGPQLARPPKNAKIICFHGIPRPKQIEYEPWVREAWSE